MSGTWVTGLRVQYGLFLCHELNVAVDGCGLGVALPLGLDDLLFCQCNQQLVSVLAIAQSEYVGSVDFVEYGNLCVKVWVG